LHSFPPRRSSDLAACGRAKSAHEGCCRTDYGTRSAGANPPGGTAAGAQGRKDCLAPHSHRRPADDPGPGDDHGPMPRPRSLSRSSSAAPWRRGLIVVALTLLAPPAASPTSSASTASRSTASTPHSVPDGTFPDSTGVGSTGDDATDVEGTGVWPLAGTPDVVTAFAPPDERWGRGHRGVDLAGAPAQPVLAALAGEVT